LKKLMLLVAALAVALLAAAPAMAQDDAAVVADSKAGVAKAGGAEAKVDCPDVPPEAKAGGVVAKAECQPKAAPPPPPAPKAAMLPATGGVSLIALGAGALLVGGGLLARRIIK
jgi:Amt family ammonium transporter